MGALRLLVQLFIPNPFIPLIIAYYSNKELGGCEIIPIILKEGDAHWAWSDPTVLTPTNTDLHLKLPKPPFSCEVLVKYGKSSLGINSTIETATFLSLQEADPSQNQYKTSQNLRHVVLFIDWFTNLTLRIRCCTTLVINNSYWNSVPQKWGQCAPSLMLFLEQGSSNMGNSAFPGCQSFIFRGGCIDMGVSKNTGTPKMDGLFHGKAY